MKTKKKAPGKLVGWAVMCRHCGVVVVMVVEAPSRREAAKRLYDTGWWDFEPRTDRQSMWRAAITPDASVPGLRTLPWANMGKPKKGAKA